MLKDKEKLTVLLDIFGKSMVTQLEEKVKKNYSTNFLAYAAEIDRRYNLIEKTEILKYNVW